MSACYLLQLTAEICKCDQCECGESCQITHRTILLLSEQNLVSNSSDVENMYVLNALLVNKFAVWETNNASNKILMESLIVV